jgi:hypothetical protein
MTDFHFARLFYHTTCGTREKRNNPKTCGVKQRPTRSMGVHRSPRTPTLTPAMCRLTSMRHARPRRILIVSTLWKSLPSKSLEVLRASKRKWTSRAARWGENPMVSDLLDKGEERFLCAPFDSSSNMCSRSRRNVPRGLFALDATNAHASLSVVE